MIKYGCIMRGLRLVGFVNSALTHNEYYAEIFGTESSITFKNKAALDEWLNELGLRLR